MTSRPRSVRPSISRETAGIRVLTRGLPWFQVSPMAVRTMIGMSSDEVSADASPTALTPVSGRQSPAYSAAHGRKTPRSGYAIPSKRSYNGLDGPGLVYPTWSIWAHAHGRFGLKTWSIWATPGPILYTLLLSSLNKLTRLARKRALKDRRYLTRVGR